MNNTRKSKRKNEEDNQKRDNTGKFKRTCGAIIHDHLCEESRPLIDLIKRSKIKASDYRALIAKGIVDESAKYICHICFDSVNFTTRQEEDNENLQNDEMEENGDDDFVSECISFGENLYIRYQRNKKY